jgi:tetratricopeptide (TPR) repeat protein
VLNFAKFHADGSVEPRGVEKVLQCYHEYPRFKSNNFIQRRGPQEEISKFFHGPGKYDLAKVVVLSGMGGCGKSQLAFDCCEQFQAREPEHLIYWINASSPITLAQSLTTFTQNVFKSIIDSTDEVAITQFFMGTMESWTTPWLLVFDNFDDPNCFIRKHLDEYFPRGRHGSILITSRHLKARNLGHTIDLTDMTEPEALELLMTRSQTEKSASNITEGKKVVARLGRHALAVDQAGAYILRHISIDRYLSDYEECREKLLNESPAFSKYRRNLKNDPEMETELTLMTTCELSYEQITGTPKAEEDRKHILTLLGFFDGTRISSDIFGPYSSEHKDWMTSCIDDDASGNWKEFLFLDILKDLRDLSLLQSLEIKKEGTWFSVHPLIQDWAKSRITSEAQQEFTIESILILSIFLQRNDSRPLPLEKSQLILTQLEAALQNDKRYLGEVDHAQNEELVDATFWFATFYCDQGRFMVAEELNRRALRDQRTILGKEHPETLASMSNLADILSRQGEYKEAEQIHRQTLELREKVLGKEHPHTLQSMNNLAVVLKKQGEYKEAEQMHRQTLEMQEKVIGKGHPGTLYSMNNLAVALRNQGKYKEAEQIHRQTLELREKVLGKEHPDTLQSMNNLAVVLSGQGKYKEAKQIHRQTLESKEKVLGKEHPETLSGMNNLALVLSGQGKYKEAEQIHRQTLELREKVLGKEHPNTLLSLHNLGYLLVQCNRFSEAKDLFRRSLHGLAKVLGLEHSYTTNSLRQLKEVLQMQGNHAEAEEVQREFGSNRAARGS